MLLSGSVTQLETEVTLSKGRAHDRSVKTTRRVSVWGLLLWDRFVPNRNLMKTWHAKIFQIIFGSHMKKILCSGVSFFSKPFHVLECQCQQDGADHMGKTLPQGPHCVGITWEPADVRGSLRCPGGNIWGAEFPTSSMVMLILSVHGSSRADML